MTTSTAERKRVVDLQGKLLFLLAGILATGAASWLTFGQGKVTREEMTQYVKDQAPWARDRGVIVAAIESNDESIGKLEEAVVRVSDSLDKYFRESADRAHKQAIAYERLDAAVKSLSDKIKVAKE